MTEENQSTQAVAPEVAPKKEYNKAFKQETFTSKRGNDYLFSYTGTRYVLTNVIAPSMINGVVNRALRRQLIMKYILEGDYGWDYWDKKLSNSKKSGSVEVEDYDGTKVTYNFKFPGFEAFNKMTEASTNDDDSLNMVEYYAQLMDHIIQNEEVNWDYWDHHDGIETVMDEADYFLGDAIADSEFQEVMNAAEAFLAKYFR